MRIVWKSAALLLVLAACDESPVSLPEPAGVAVAGSTMSLLVGDAAPVAAQVTDQEGRVMQGLAPVYSTDNPSVATVNADGMVRGVGPGTANVSATYGASSALVKVTVSPDRRGELQSLELMADSVVADVRAGVQTVAVRAFNGLGQPVCPQLSLHSSDPSVATARVAGTCRIEVTPAFAGETTITADADGRTDSFRVRVSSSGAVAFFSARPSASQLVAGATVGYTVKVLDEANQAVPNQRINLDVSVGTLSATTVTTRADGTATVQWTLPTHLQEWGQTHFISFRALLPNGAIVSRSELVFVNGASMAEIVVQTASSGSAYVRTEADSVVVPAYGIVYMSVTGMDQYGNPRVVDWTFSATSTGQYWFWSCGGTAGWSLGSGEYTCFYSYPGDLNVTARAASGEQRSVRFIFRP